MSKMRTTRRDIADIPFGQLTAKRRVESRNKRTCWLCECSCGRFVVVQLTNLTSGHTTSCGCSTNHTHGDTAYGETTTEYTAWKNMRRRCCDPTFMYYEDYGGRGIEVCNQWLNSYENFLADMGRKPAPEYSLDRIDNDGDYTPSNCRWATPEQQANNKVRK